ncbi:MAG: hypothetical protein ACFFDN_00330 [Candidatus Hodarchaeota archaeon]
MPTSRKIRPWWRIEARMDSGDGNGRYGHIYFYDPKDSYSYLDFEHELVGIREEQYRELFEQLKKIFEGCDICGENKEDLTKRIIKTLKDKLYIKESIDNWILKEYLNRIIDAYHEKTVFDYLTKKMNQLESLMEKSNTEKDKKDYFIAFDTIRSINIQLSKNLK